MITGASKLIFFSVFPSRRVVDAYQRSKLVSTILFFRNQDRTTPVGLPFARVCDAEKPILTPTSDNDNERQGEVSPNGGQLRPSQSSFTALLTIGLSV